MAEENITQEATQIQRTANKQNSSGNESKPPKTAAPKPEPSYGIIDEGRFWSPLKRSEKAVNS
ncbi:MAG: hypothetical protein OXG23_00845 [Chloroflexi bacterium]|nr:hypothetical protein [Chloroflexota bacterium]